MKKLYLFILLIAVAFRASAIGESENNDTWGQADLISIGQSGTGQFNPNGETDWWYFNTLNDGNLHIPFSSLNGQNVFCEVFDTLGVIQLSTSVYTAGNSNVYVNGLAAGTYYIRLKPYFGTESTTYSFTINFTTPTEANDIEFNDSYLSAQVLNLNDSTTGHVNYYYNGYSKDTADWYALNVTQDGDLSYTIRSGNGQNVFAVLYDGNGTSVLAGNYTTTSATYSKGGMAPGIYYIKIYTYYSSEYAPYTLINNYTTPGYNNDMGMNNYASNPTIMPLNGTMQGHIGYRYNGTVDHTDWYSITVTEDGLLSYTLTVSNGQNVFAQLYDGDTTTLLAGNYTTTSATYSRNGMAQGVYYLKVFTYYNWEYAPYQISNTYTTTGYANDIGNNDLYTAANVLPINSTSVGHIGYAYNGYDDLNDWYSITLPQDGKLEWTITSHNSQNVFAQVFDYDGTTLLGGNYTTNTATYSLINLAAGTYYINIRNYYTTEFSPYTLSSSFTPKTFAAENSSNNDYAKLATTLAANTATTGHINYYYNSTYDQVDWWKIGFDSNDTLRIKFELEQNVHNGSYPYVYYDLYSDTAAAPLQSFLFQNPTTNLSLTGLAVGTYYIRLSQGFNSFGAYRITATFQERCLNTVVINSSSQTIPCNGSINYTVSGGVAPYSVQLYKNGIANGVVQTTNGAIAFTNLSPGTYYLRSYSFGASGICNNVSGNTVFSQPGVPTITPSGATSFCSGGSVTLMSSSANSYLWSNGATTQSITVSTTGSYSVTVYNAALCDRTSAPQSVTVYPGMTLSTTVTNLSCYKSNDGSMYIQISGGTQPFTYLWSDGRTNKNRPAVKAGNYTFTVTDANGCTASVSITVTQPNKLLGTKVKTPVSCNGGNDGACTVNITGGTPPYTYVWNTVPAQTTNTATGLAKGVYSCITTDANGCTRKNTVVIPEPAILWINMTKTDVTTNGGSDGTCTATPAGGNAPYSYVWNNGATTSTITGLTAGTYTCTVTDSKGCTVSKNKNVNQPAIAGSGEKMDDNAFIQSMLIYPNPNMGVFSIMLDENLDNENFEVSVFDQTGRVVYQGMVYHIKGEPHSFDLNRMENGIYRIRFVGKDKVIQSNFSIMN